MMKKAIIFVLILLFSSVSVSAQWIALYADYERSATSVQGVGVDDIVTVFLFVQPTALGIECIELNSFTYGDGVYAIDDIEYHPESYLVTGGFPNSDLVGCWYDCHYDWTYYCAATLVLQSDVPFCINIRGIQGPPSQPVPRGLECMEDWFPYVPQCNFCVNQLSQCEVAVGESSWGAIKSLYE